MILQKLNFGIRNVLKQDHTDSIDLDQNPTTIYLCSDGYQDQFGGENGRKFMVKQLRESLLVLNKLDLNSQKESLSRTFDNWKGRQKQVDDVMIIGLKINC